LDKKEEELSNQLLSIKEKKVEFYSQSAKFLEEKKRLGFVQTALNEKENQSISTST
jgi:hypothetical protein